jgi:hypothetical protein
MIEIPKDYWAVYVVGNGFDPFARFRQKYGEPTRCVVGSKVSTEIPDGVKVVNFDVRPECIWITNAPLDNH